MFTIFFLPSGEKRGAFLKLKVKVKPGSRKNEVKVTGPDALEVRVTAAPEKGKANKAVIELLAKHYKVPKSSIHIIRGQSSKEKIIEIL